MLCFLKIEGKTLHHLKDDDSLYCNTHCGGMETNLQNLWCRLYRQLALKVLSNVQILWVAKKTSYCLLIRLWGQVLVWRGGEHGNKFPECLLAQFSSVVFGLDVCRF